MTEISYWFDRRRGIAVAIASCGNYLSGVIWPPLIQHFIEINGWRPAQIGIGLICIVTILPLALALRRRAAGSGDRLERGRRRQARSRSASRRTR